MISVFDLLYRLFLEVQLQIYRDQARLVIVLAYFIHNHKISDVVYLLWVGFDCQRDTKRRLDLLLLHVEVWLIQNRAALASLCLA